LSGVNETRRSKKATRDQTEGAGTKREILWVKNGRGLAGRRRGGNRKRFSRRERWYSMKRVRGVTVDHEAGEGIDKTESWIYSPSPR